MKILIVDDEMPARVRLRRMLEELNRDDIIIEAVNGMEGLKSAQQHAPDVALLDIRMPGMDGIELARHLSEFAVAPAIIFTTAYDEYALSAFDAHAVDYLLKPIRSERLQKALQSCKKLNRAQLQDVQLEIRQESSVSPEHKRTHISARMGSEMRMVPIDEVRYFLAEDKYVTVRYLNGQVLIEDSLKTLFKEFPDRFIRIHRNALVALRYIAALENDGQGHCRIRIKDSNEMLDVSRRHLPFVRRALKQL